MHVSVPSRSQPLLPPCQCSPDRRSETFDLSSNFPASNLLVRNPAGDTVRSLYMVNDIVKSIVKHNDYARIRLMTAGTKVFGKQEGAEAKREGADSHFRVLSEGLPVVLPFVGPTAIVQADFAALKVFMEGYYPLISGFAEPFQSMIAAKGLWSDRTTVLASRPRPSYSSNDCSSQWELCRPLPAWPARRRYVSVPRSPFPQPCSLGLPSGRAKARTRARPAHLEVQRVRHAHAR